MIKLISIPAILTFLVLQCGTFSRHQPVKTTSAAFMQMVSERKVESYEIVGNLKKVNVFLVQPLQPMTTVAEPGMPRRYLEKREPDMVFKYVGDFEKEMNAYFLSKQRKPLSYSVINETNWW
jgi:hypothetical protein